MGWVANGLIDSGNGARYTLSVACLNASIFSRRGAVVKGVDISTNLYINIWVARVRVPLVSISRDLNSQKLNY